MVGVLLFCGVKSRVQLPNSNGEFAKVTVSIVSMNEKSGGTGVILESKPNDTKILTNKHVCELIQVGGLVKTDKGEKYPVRDFRVYSKHDLCLIGITADLGVSTKVASKEPKTYSDLTISGHPALLPTIISRGHFSQQKEIELMVGTKPCTGNEHDDEAMMCMFFGVKPLMKKLTAHVTNALIMPGSSGSGVFNDKGELTALVFAGSQGLSYGFLVPYEYVSDFLSNVSSYKLQTPNPKKKPSSFFTAIFKIEGFCAAKQCEKIKTFELYVE